MNQTIVPFGTSVADVEAIKPPGERDPLMAQAAAVLAIQKFLDSAAQAHGYDGILSLCSYKNSSNPKWVKEADYGIWLRDEAWSRGQVMQDAVLAGGPVPTEDEVMRGMPPVEWPV